MLIFVDNKNFDLHHVRRVTFDSRMRDFLQHLFVILDTSKILLYVTLTFYIIFVLRVKYFRDQNDEMIRKHMKKIRRRIKYEKKNQKSNDEKINEVIDSNHEKLNRDK